MFLFLFTRFENSSKFNNFNDLIAPDWDKNKSEICPGPCLPDFDNDGILDNQGHLEKLIQDVEPVLTPYGKEVLTYDITGLKVYIYDLPAKFNSDLAKCASKNRANSMCFDFANTGFGPKMDINIKLPKYLRFYKTHQFSLEVIFHEKLLRSPHLTTDPKQATLFYVPYYAALSCFCNIETGQNLTSEFWSFAQNLTYLETGKVHFMALGKVEQVTYFPFLPFGTISEQEPRLFLLKLDQVIIPFIIIIIAFHIDKHFLLYK